MRDIARHPLRSALYKPDRILYEAWMDSIAVGVVNRFDGNCSSKVVVRKGFQNKLFRKFQAWYLEGRVSDRLRIFRREI